MKASGKRKNKATFVIQIQSCEHATWQGKLTWADTDRSISFRSALELIGLIDEAVGSDDGETETDS